MVRINNVFPSFINQELKIPRLGRVTRKILIGVQRPYIILFKTYCSNTDTNQ